MKQCYVLLRQNLSAGNLAQAAASQGRQVGTAAGQCGAFEARRMLLGKFMLALLSDMLISRSYQELKGRLHEDAVRRCMQTGGHRCWAVQSC